MDQRASGSTYARQPLSRPLPPIATPARDEEDLNHRMAFRKTSSPATAWSNGALDDRRSASTEHSVDAGHGLQVMHEGHFPTHGVQSRPEGSLPTSQQPTSVSNMYQSYPAFFEFGGPSPMDHSYPPQVSDQRGSSAEPLRLNHPAPVLKGAPLHVHSPLDNEDDMMSSHSPTHHGGKASPQLGSPADSLADGHVEQQQSAGGKTKSRRGRKQDDSLPPSRARDVQRAFRARRAARRDWLEQRVAELEQENAMLKQQLTALGIPLSPPDTGSDVPRHEVPTMQQLPLPGRAGQRYEAYDFDGAGEDDDNAS